MSTVADVIKGQHVFLEGPAGSGKTTAAIARIKHLLDEGAHADEILFARSTTQLHDTL